MRRCAVLWALYAPLALAQQDADLDLIPQFVIDAPQEAAAVPRVSSGRYFHESVYSRQWLRDDLLVPYPDDADGVAPWQYRTSLDARDERSLTPSLKLGFSNRLNLTAQREDPQQDALTLRNDLREAYLSWEPATRRYLEIGRINQREGVAQGYNPTDFFRARSQVAQASADPSAQRENRLGAVMLRAQSIWNGGALSLIYAPRLESPRPLEATRPAAFDPQLDRTNGSERVMLALSWELAGLSPRALWFSEEGDTRLGLNLSRGIGDSVVAYAEWAAGHQRPLSAQAVAFATGTGSVPDGLPPLPGGDAERWRHDLSLGMSWAGGNRLTLNLEYHRHGAGYSRDDWRQWFELGAAGAANPALAEALWYLRAYAEDRQQPMSRERWFLRAEWNDAFVPKLKLGGFVLLNPDDGSSFVQLATSYAWTDHWGLAAYWVNDLGGRDSEFGSLPQQMRAIFQLVHYF